MSFVSLLKIKKQNNQYNFNGISDDRYYELKYKLQFITSVGVIIVAVAGFFGVDKFENFVTTYNKKTDSLDVRLKTYNKKISKLDSIISTYDSKIKDYDDFVRNVDWSKTKFSQDIINSNKGLLNLNNKIDAIKKRNILDKSFYVVDNLVVKNALIPENGNGITRFYFKDLTTIIGDKVPEFDKPPVTFVIPQSSSFIYIWSLTTEYFEVSFTGYNRDENKEEPKTFTFGVLIARKQI